MKQSNNHFRSSRGDRIRVQGKTVWNFCAISWAWGRGHGLTGSRGGPKCKPESSTISCLFTPRSKPAENGGGNPVRRIEICIYACYMFRCVLTKFDGKTEHLLVLKLAGRKRWEENIRNKQMAKIRQSSEADGTWIDLAWARSPLLKAEISLLIWWPK